MLNKWILGAGCFFLSSICMAEASTEMKKDEWLGKLKEVVPAMICKNFMANVGISKQLANAKIDYDKCVSLIPASFDKCQPKYYADIPATINQESAGKWGNTIGECIGTDFAVNYLISSPSSDTTTPGATTPGATTPGATTPGTTTPGTTSGDLSKDSWLSSLKLVVPDLICKGFLEDASLGKQLANLKIDHDKCISLIPASFDKCQKELYPSIPATITEEGAGKWGQSIGECIGKDFAIKYLI